MIPSNITREQIIQAISEIKKGKIPPYRESTRWSILHNGEHFPPKYVISLANELANGRELDPSQFSGGDETNNFLKERGFDIVEKTTSVQVIKIVTHDKDPIRAAEVLYEDGVIAVGWTDFGDLTGKTKEEIQQISQTEWGRTDQQSLRDANQLVTFRDKIHKGDLVIAYRTKNVVAMIGEIEGDYYFDDKNRVGNPGGELRYANQRKVVWWEKPRNFNRSHLPSPLKEKVALPGTILICAENYDKLTLVESLESAGLQVSFRPAENRRGQQDEESTFIKLLQEKKQIILYGPPGTGKTYEAQRFAIGFLLRSTRANGRGL
jgi:hypothetical protein